MSHSSRVLQLEARPERSEGLAEVSVLIVDDEPAILLLVEEVLRRSGDGFEVVGSASGGHEGLHLWQELRPDVVVLDLSMPDLDGDEVAQQIRETDPDQAIVLFSAHITKVATVDGSLRVPKKQAPRLPELISQWLERRTATGADCGSAQS